MLELKEKVAEDIIQQHLKGPAVVGINGLDCSGKTYFSNQLSHELYSYGYNNKILHVDDFNDREFQSDFYSTYIEYGKSAIDLENYYEYSVNYSHLVKEIKESISNSHILIVEGVFLFKPLLLDLFSYKVFLRINYAKAMERFSERKEIENDQRPKSVMTDIWIPAHEKYIQHCNPEEIANVVHNS